MKRTLLLLTTVAMSFGATNAQTHSDLSGNAPTASNDGYIFNFDGSDGNNCVGQHVNVNPGYTNSASNGNLVIVVDKDEPTIEDWSGASFKFYNGDCSGQTVNLKNDGNIEILIHSTVAVPSFNFFLCDGSDVCADAAYLNPALVAGDNLLTFNQTNWNQWNAVQVDSLAISYAKMVFREGAYGTAHTSGTYTVKYIKVGDQTGLTLTASEDEVVSNSLSVYPNPASTSVNVSFEASADAAVSLSDLTGSSVANASASKGINNVSFDVSGLASGLYILSITTADGVVTRKVTVD